VPNPSRSEAIARSHLPTLGRAGQSALSRRKHSCARRRKSTRDTACLNFFHAIALALAGRAEESTTSVQRGFELEPGFRIRIFNEFGMARPIAEKFAEGTRRWACRNNRRRETVYRPRRQISNAVAQLAFESRRKSGIHHGRRRRRADMAPAFENRRLGRDRPQWAHPGHNRCWRCCRKKRSTNAANTDSY
jgi:hypothetical protein